jgi:hypothetical protein
MMPALLACLAFQVGKEIPVAPGEDLGAAAVRAGSGGTLILAPGRHSPGQITIPASLAGLAIRSGPGGRAAIDFEGKGGITLQADRARLQDLDILNARNFGVDVDASDVVLEGCRILGSGGDAVKLSPGPWKQGRYHRGATIRRCEIGKNAAFEGVDCVGMDDVRILECHIHDTPGWGVYLKGGASRGLIEGCLFERCGTLPANPAGGACLGEHTGPDEVMTRKHGMPWESVDSVVRNNVFVDVDSAAMAAWCARNATFANNTCVNVAVRDRAAFIVLGNHGLPSTDVTFVNNIVVGSKEGGRPLAWLYDKGSAGRLRFENNCWWGGNGRFLLPGPGDFAAWQAAGFDRAGFLADPRLGPDRRLLPGSPCIDRGLTLPGFDGDVDGGRRSGAWDIGADEFGVPSGRR